MARAMRRARIGAAIRAGAQPWLGFARFPSGTHARALSCSSAVRSPQVGLMLRARVLRLLECVVGTECEHVCAARCNVLGCEVANRRAVQNLVAATWCQSDPAYVPTS
jgi:hypothetical protein